MDSLGFDIEKQSSGNGEQPSSSSKILVMAERYSLYLQEKSKINQPSRLLRILADVHFCMSVCWNKITPVFFRGISNEHQLFYQICKSACSQGKQCTLENLQISCKTIEQNLSEGKEVIGIVYSKNTIAKVVDAFKGKLGEFLSRQYELCPICIEGQVFAKDLGPKINERRQMLVIFWRGLFDQLIILKTIPLAIHEQDIWLSTQQITLEISECIGGRKQYESQIKMTAETADSSLPSELFTQHKLTSAASDDDPTNY